ncbi:MAG: hypothetical protein PF495_07685 [Spirochaetales bacterium]|jgi:hypothetical protein|nr:hypothetical protein [Spirochaetales bacterium]
MNRKIILIILTAILVSGIACSSLKRHAAAEYKGEDNSLAAIDLFGYDLYEQGDITGPGNLWALNATAQANLREILDRRFPDNESFIRALNNKYISAAGRPDDAGYINKNLRLVLSVSKKRDYRQVGRKSRAGHPAAGRIEYLRISLSLPDESGLKFTGWNRFTSEYADLEVGDISFNRSLDLSLGAGISENEKVRRSADADIKAILSQKENQVVRYRYLKLNGRISGSRIEIEEEGTREIDLTGNVTADVSLSFASFPEKVFIPLFTGDSKDKTETLTLMAIDTRVPLITHAPAPVKAILEMDYVYRHVAEGSDTFQEWDDDVEYYTGKVQREITLLDINDYLPPFHTIGVQSSPGEIIRLKSGTGKYYALKFRDYDQASSFHEWLLRKASACDEMLPLRAGQYTLHLGGKALTPGLIKEKAGLAVLPYYLL